MALFSKIPDLPSTEDVPVGSLTWLKNWLDLLRVWVQSHDPDNTLIGDPLDKFTTRKELVGVGLLKRSSDGTFKAGSVGGGTTVVNVVGGTTGGTTYTPDLTPPPTPTGLAVTAGIAFINITIDAPTYTQGHGNGRTLFYGAIWAQGAAEPTFADLRTKLIDSIQKTDVICSYPTEPNMRWCIWAVFETVDGINGIASGHIAGGAHGIQGTTGQDVSALLSILTGQITNSLLYPALGARIDLVDAASSVPGSVNYRLSATSVAYAAADASTLASAKSYTDAYAYALTDGTAVAGNVTTLVSRQGRVVNYRVQSFGYSSLYGEGSLRSEDGTLLMTGLRSYNLVVLNGSTAAVESALAYDVFGNGATTSGRNAASLAGALNALGPDKVVLIFTVDEPLGNSTVSGLPDALKRCGATQATLDRFKSRGAYILAGIPGLGEGTGIERYAGDTVAASNAWVELSLQLINGRPVGMAGQSAVSQISAALQTESSTRAALDGSVAALYTLRAEISSGGRTVVGGFGLSATASATAGPRIDFGVRADQFYVVAPSGSGVSDAKPFVIRTTTTTEGNATIPAGVYMDAAYIVNLTASYSKIAILVADQITAADISVTKLTAGSLRVGSYIQSTGYTSGVSGWRIPADGNVELNSGTFRGALAAATGTFAGSLVAATGSFSGSLSAATGTFNGDVSAATGTFTGSVSVNGATWLTGNGVFAGMDSGFARFRVGSASQYLTYDSSTGALTLKQDTFSVVAGTSGSVSFTGNGAKSLGRITAVPTGGVAPYSFAWSISVFNDAGSSALVDKFIAYRDAVTSAAFQCDLITTSNAATGAQVTSYVSAYCTVTDSNGRTAVGGSTTTVLWNGGLP